jgi:chorismate mutase
MLKKKLSDKECANIVGRSVSDWKAIVMKKKIEDPGRIESMINRLEKYERGRF